MDLACLACKDHARSPFPGVLPNTRRPEGLSGFFLAVQCVLTACVGIKSLVYFQAGGLAATMNISSHIRANLRGLSAWKKKRRTEYFGSGSGLEGSGIGRNITRNEWKTGQIGFGDKFKK